MLLLATTVNGAVAAYGVMTFYEPLGEYEHGEVAAYGGLIMYCAY